MIARQMVVRCSKCGRRFIRSMSNRSLFELGFGASPVCDKCKYANSGGPTLGDIFKKRKK